MRDRISLPDGKVVDVIRTKEELPAVRVGAKIEYDGETLSETVEVQWYEFYSEEDFTKEVEKEHDRCIIRLQHKVAEYESEKAGKELLADLGLTRATPEARMCANCHYGGEVDYHDWIACSKNKIDYPRPSMQDLLKTEPFERTWVMAERSLRVKPWARCPKFIPREYDPDEKLFELDGKW